MLEEREKEHKNIQINAAQTLSYLSPPSATDIDIEPSNTEDTTTPHLADLSTRHPNRPMTLYKGPHSLFRVLSPKYRLNKAEYLQIYNLRPSTTLELDLVVQEVRPSPSFSPLHPSPCTSR